MTQSCWFSHLSNMVSMCRGMGKSVTTKSAICSQFLVSSHRWHFGTYGINVCKISERSCQRKKKCVFFLHSKITWHRCPKPFMITLSLSLLQPNLLYSNCAANMLKTGLWQLSYYLLSSLTRSGFLKSKKAWTESTSVVKFQLLQNSSLPLTI